MLAYILVAVVVVSVLVAVSVQCTALRVEEAVREGGDGEADR